MKPTRFVPSFTAMLRVGAFALLAVVLAACASSQPPAELDGSWRGTWSSSSDRGGGMVSATFTRSETAITGRVTIGGSPCLTSGNITGEVTGSSVTFGAVQGSDRVNFTGRITGGTLSGTYSVPTSFSICSGDTGTFTVEKTN